MKRWENNIAEWTGLKFCHAVREAENKIKWRERVCNVCGAQQSLTTGWVQVYKTLKYTSPEVIKQLTLESCVLYTVK